MRTIKLHASVGYELPQHRASCRHCTQLTGGHDDRHGFGARWLCKEHKFDVQLGGVCPDFDWKGPAYNRIRRGERDDMTADMFAMHAGRGAQA